MKGEYWFPMHAPANFVPTMTVRPMSAARPRKAASAITESGFNERENANLRG